MDIMNNSGDLSRFKSRMGFKPLTSGNGYSNTMKLYKKFAESELDGMSNKKSKLYVESWIESIPAMKHTAFNKLEERMKIKSVDEILMSIYTKHLNKQKKQK